MKLLREGMELLPYNLQGLKLELFYNGLRQNVENIEYLAEGMKKLPKNL